jgi:hypothetical protein
MTQPAADTPRLPDEVRVVNVGLATFADAVAAQGAQVQHVDWRIPGAGDPATVSALEQLNGPRGDAVDQANAEVVRRLDRGSPHLTGIVSLGSLLASPHERVLLHPGPALTWSRMCDPLCRSVRATAVAEGWAGDLEEADRLLSGGWIRLEPAHRYQVVLPMASSVGPSAPVFEVVDEAGSTRAYAPVNQGPGDTAWFGRESPAAVERLTFLRDVAGPMLARVLQQTGPIDLFSLAAQGVQMGDDVHMRTQATTNLLIRNLLPRLVALPDAGRSELARFLSGNHLFFLNLAMAAAKAVALWAEQVEGSSIVTTMCRNGTTYGIRLAGGEHLVTAEAPRVDEALYHGSYGPDEAARDIGDSAVLELVGLGAASAAGSAAVAGFVGGRLADAAALTEEMALICAGSSSRFTIPAWNNAGTPLGVDARRVVELGVTPRVTTGILHGSSGAGQIGAGVASAPRACFRAAVLELARGAESP